jgi:hypothetical protein
MNKRLAHEIESDEEELDIMFMDFEIHEAKLDMPKTIACAWSGRLESLAADMHAHLVCCKACNAQRALARRAGMKPSIAAKAAKPALKSLSCKLPEPISIGRSYGMPLLAMGGTEETLVSRIPLPLDKGSLFLKAGANGLCQAWAEPGSLSFELVATKGNAVLSRVFFKPKQPPPSFSLTGAEALNVKFDGFQKPDKA